MIESLIQIIMALLGSVGFAILFNIKRDKISIIAFGGAMSWICYLFFYSYNANKVISLFISTFILSIFAEIISRKIKTPVIIILIPILVPLIPGGDLYYTMYNLVTNNMDSFIYFFNLVIKEAAAISFGIILVTSIMQIITKVKKYYIRKRPY